MIYRKLGDAEVSALGFGAMRLPQLANGEIDEKKTEEMVDLCMKSGVNYYDTAFPYHGGKSEIVLGKCLSKYDRKSYFLANKYPGHQVASKYDPAETFAIQLKKCNVDYFDFYLLHNVCESSLPVYDNPEYGIIDYFVKQKAEGKIKHLGFSTHAQLECLEKILEKYGDKMDFCQIQLNYLDWTLQNADKKVELLKKYNIPIIVMEPVRGGKLAKLSEDKLAMLYEAASEEKTESKSTEDAVSNENALVNAASEEKGSAASYGFRWLLGIDESVKVILSGMTEYYQVEDNLKTFNNYKPLNDKEVKLLYAYAEEMKASVPCTACKYCVEGCPMGLDIPTMLQVRNELQVAMTTNSAMVIEFLPEDKKPDVCIKCGACANICPQKINIPSELEWLAEKMKALPKWREISKAREEEAKQFKL
ncbi:MAG: aldo/keto reductase [Lachnospiraceae bacterium]|nr:aldo/keto reductase [Lachnospiraceae bacterium]